MQKRGELSTLFPTFKCLLYLTKVLAAWNQKEHLMLFHLFYCHFCYEKSSNAFPIFDVTKIETCWYNSGEDDSSDGGIESKVVLDQLDLAEVEEAVDALDAGEFSTQLEVDDHTEGDHQQGVAEEPEHLEYRLFVSLSEKTCGEHGSEGKHNEVDETPLLSCCFPIPWRSGKEQAEK